MPLPQSRHLHTLQPRTNKGDKKYISDQVVPTTKFQCFVCVCGGGGSHLDMNKSRLHDKNMNLRGWCKQVTLLAKWSKRSHNFCLSAAHEIPGIGLLQKCRERLRI
jgi:hypothetical protein